MQGFAPGLLDKLMMHGIHKNPSGVDTKLLSLEELKESVAYDLESLLNTRKLNTEDLMKSYPECAKSIVTYGLSDFAGLSLASTDDRAFICRALEQTIARHEPRLREVKAALAIQESSTNKLNFAISAMLVAHPGLEPVNFDAILQPSSQHYSISKSRRSVRIGTEHG